VSYAQDYQETFNIDDVWQKLEQSQWKRMMDLDATYEEYAGGIIIITVLWLILPINKICACFPCCDVIRKMQEEMRDDNVTYQERLPYFTDCYDTTNPLT
jgi:hypothetical protein